MVSFLINFAKYMYEHHIKSLYFRTKFRSYDALYFRTKKVFLFGDWCFAYPLFEYVPFKNKKCSGIPIL